MDWEVDSPFQKKNRGCGRSISHHTAGTRSKGHTGWRHKWTGRLILHIKSKKKGCGRSTSHHTAGTRSKGHTGWRHRWVLHWGGVNKNSRGPQRGRSLRRWCHGLGSSHPLNQAFGMNTSVCHETNVRIEARSILVLLLLELVLLLVEHIHVAARASPSWANPAEAA
jgi:hypothetical protein